MATTTDRAAIQAAIKADPMDYVARFALADWLDECGRAASAPALAAIKRRRAECVRAGAPLVGVFWRDVAARLWLRAPGDFTYEEETRFRVAACVPWEGPRVVGGEGVVAASWWYSADGLHLTGLHSYVAYDEPARLGPGQLFVREWPASRGYNRTLALDIFMHPDHAHLCDPE
jgi:uncharacterized protein (TIGR02996 family)